MINKKLDFSTAPEFIQQFENENIEYLKQLRFYNWSLWQIIKVPVFYKLLQKDNGQPTTSKPKNRTQQRIKNACNEITSFLKITLGGFKKDSILCITHYADCLFKKDDKFYNSLFDYIISQKKKHPIYHWEITSLTKSPRYNEPQIKLQAAETFYSRISKTHVAEPQSATQQFVEIWNGYALQKKTDVSVITEDFVNSTCLSFYQSYLFWKFSFKKKKPSKIFSSEKMGTGMLAAANELRIPYYEFQHGNIDEHYPPYVWNEGWNKVANNLKPDYLVVFGQTAEKTASVSGFFANENIIAVGYEKMEGYRAIKSAEQGYIFFALQPMMHELNKEIVQHVKILSHKCKVAVKYHPLQPQYEIDDYEILLKGSKVTIFDKSKNIYDCILESKIIVSHVSTVLEEALSLGKVSITIATEELPAGIHSMTGNIDLQKAIIPVQMKELPAFLGKILADNIFFENVMHSVKKNQFEIYCSGYYGNISQLIKN